MAQIPLYVFAGLGALLVLSAMALGYPYFVRINAERRMRAMLEAVGIDPAIIDEEDLEETIAGMRARCVRCTDKSRCERWLAGDEDGGNAFCPNRELFGMLRRYNWYAS